MLCKCVYEVDLNTSSADVNDACGGEGECIQGSGDWSREKLEERSTETRQRL